MYSAVYAPLGPALARTRKLPLSVHLKVWSSTFKSYGQSFEETFNWDRRRQEQTIKDNAAKSVEALKEIAKDVREATHNTPEVRSQNYCKQSTHSTVSYAVHSQHYIVGSTLTTPSYTVH